MKIHSGNNRAPKWSIPVAGIIVLVCFAIGVFTTRFGATAPTAPSGKKPAPKETQALNATPQAPAVVPQAEPIVGGLVPKPLKAASKTGKKLAAPSAQASTKVHPKSEPTPTAGSAFKGIVQEQVEVFGHSVRGKELIAYRLGNGANHTMIFGDFHGNERSVPGVVEDLYKYLKQHPEEWPNCTVIIVPYANPDGWADGTRVNAHGVDINRNFPGTWKATGRAARYNPGPSAGSEPETKAIISLVDKYDPTKIVSLHQPLHMLNWTGDPGKRLATVMHNANGYRISDDVGYATPGAFGDYCGMKSIAIVTMELPNNNVSNDWVKDRKALLAAINAPI